MIELSKVDELSEKLKKVNRDISEAQDALDNLKKERTDLEKQMRKATSGRKTNA